LTLTAIVGALMALLPKPEKPVQSPVDSEVDRLTRSHARLVDHIERLERELLLEQHLCIHWREAAMRIAKQSREAREQYQPQQQLLPQNPQQALAQAQLNSQYAQALYQHAQNQQAAQWQGFCNCVPSRSQVWEANRGEG
jgi:hypothetical protein